MHHRVALYIGSFFCVAHFALILPIITPYLATFLPESVALLIISLGAFLTLVAFPFMPVLVRSIGPRVVALGLATLMLCSFVWLALSPSVIPAVLLVATIFAVQPLFMYLFDLLLEATVTSEGETGRIRTLLIVSANVALASGPLCAGLVLGSTNEYWRVFLLGALSLIPFIVLFSVTRFPSGTKPSLSSMKEVFACIFKDKDLRAVSIAYATLESFYHLAPFFVPLYLHTVLGIPWSELGIIFGLMMLPFILITYPAGWLADNVLGDQEIMALGFLVLGTSFAALAFVSNVTPLISIAIVLVLTRVGAALVQASTESHFFRRVSQYDVNTVGVFRSIRPMVALMVPALGSLLLVLSTYNILFFIAGLVIIVIGVASALSIRDVR